MRQLKLKAILVIGIIALATPTALLAQSNDEAMSVVRAYQQVFRDVAQKVLPWVVEVETVETVRVPNRGMTSPFEFFFGRPDPRGDNQSQEREFEQRGIGSGIIVRRDDDKVYVLTNNHVAGKAEKINLTLNDGRTFQGSLVGTDPNKDLALVVFETQETVPVAELGDSYRVEVGDLVMAVGNPLGFESTVTSGMVSAIGRQVPERRGLPILTDYIQTDAAINRGNSGGPLVNLDGEVIGINTWIASQSGGNIGLGFAIPINNARRSIDQFISKGRVDYGWLGVNMATAPASTSDSLSESKGGAFVFGVFRDSPADSAGILPGDIIVEVDGQPVGNGNDLLQAVTNLEPGQRVPFVVHRYGQRRTVNVRTGVRPSDDEEGAQASELWPGLSVVEITDQIRENLDVSVRAGDIIVSQVAPGSPAATAGLQSGDIIQRVNSEEVKTLREFYRALNSTESDEIVFRIRRDDTYLILGLVRE